MRFVLDASVAAAWYLPESFAQKARHWQSRLLSGEIEFVVPSLHFWELANVFRTYVRRDELDANDAIEAYELHCAAPLETADPLKQSVLNVALEYGTTSYDAVYIALAIEQDAQLLTAENPRREWLKALKKRVISLG